MTAEELINQYVTAHADNRWMDASELEALLTEFAEKLKEPASEDLEETYKQLCGYMGIAFMQFLDKIRAEGKMCLSNGECANIDNAFALGDWDMIFRYIEKYIKK